MAELHPCQWPDYSGKPIHHGDRLRHPSGETFLAVLTSTPEPADGMRLDWRPWRALYDGDVRTTSDLGLQIGDKGMAVVVESFFGDMLAALQSAEWMLARDRIDPEKMKVLEQVQDAIRAAGGKARYG